MWNNWVQCVIRSSNQKWNRSTIQYASPILHCAAVRALQQRGLSLAKSNSNSFCHCSASMRTACFTAYVKRYFGHSYRDTVYAATYFALACKFWRAKFCTRCDRFQTQNNCAPYLISLQLRKNRKKVTFRFKKPINLDRRAIVSRRTSIKSFIFATLSGDNAGRKRERISLPP